LAQSYIFLALIVRMLNTHLGLFLTTTNDGDSDDTGMDRERGKVSEMGKVPGKVPGKVSETDKVYKMVRQPGQQLLGRRQPGQRP
jgi:hypothetical protein